MNDRLTDKNAVERITVKTRKAGDLECGFLVQSKFLSREFFSMSWDELLRPLRQWQLSERILDAYFPR